MPSHHNSQPPCRPGGQLGLLPRRHLGGRVEPRAWKPHSRTDRPTTASTPASACWRTNACPTTSFTFSQRNLLLSHAVGVGEPVPPEITRRHAAAEDPRPRPRLLRRVAADLPPLARLRSVEPVARSCRVAAASAPAAISRRSRICACRSSASASFGTTQAEPGKRVPPRMCCARTTCRRSNSARRTASRSSTARNS